MKNHKHVKRKENDNIHKDEQRNEHELLAQQLGWIMENK